MYKIIRLAVLPAMLATQISSTNHVTLLKADASQDTYTLINKSLAPIKGDVVEVSDCSHKDFGPHITQAFDKELGKDVFVFHAHVDYDNDRCQKMDRQRTEIKTYGASGDHLVGTAGEKHTYTWLFKLDKDFQPTTSFTHIHQIKAIGGSDSMPMLTFSPRKKKINTFEIRYALLDTAENIASVPLEPFLGEWIVAEETIVYGEEGSLEITLSRKRDNKTLLTLNKQLNMWRSGATLIRPKWGIYRSLNKKEDLRDEQVRFADFQITEY